MVYVGSTLHSTYMSPVSCAACSKPKSSHDSRHCCLQLLAGWALPVLQEGSLHHTNITRPAACLSWHVSDTETHL